jgi:site-specific recombinase XerD
VTTEIEEGDTVVDQDADFPRNAALVVNRTEIPASKIEIPELDATVAEVNPRYSEDAAVAVVAFVKELRNASPDYAERTFHGLRKELRQVDVQTYSYPVPRLKVVQERSQQVRTDGGDDDRGSSSRYLVAAGSSGEGRTREEGDRGSAMQGTTPDGQLEPLTPDEGVELFLDLRERDSSIRDSTLENDRTRLGPFLEWCEETEVENLNDLTGRKLDQFVSWRATKLAPITLQKQLGSIREALRYWADIEAVPEGLAEKVHAPEIPDGAESRDDNLDADRAEAMLEHLDRYHFGSRRHAVLALLWRTGMRRSALRSLDVDDLLPDDHAVELTHRLDAGTRLKNGEAGERVVYLGPRWYNILKAYLENPERHDVVDDHGRHPVFTSRYGRPTGDTIYSWVNKLTQPCEYGECPHDRDKQACEARGTDGAPSKCPSARSPHDVRRGAITAHLNDETPPEVVSERMDVSLDVLYQHYDARTEKEKMAVRKKHLEE